MTEDFNWDLEVDVVVLGSGGAAMTAAISAHDFRLSRRASPWGK